MKKFIWAILCLCFVFFELSPKITVNAVAINCNTLASSPRVENKPVKLYKEKSDTVAVFNSNGTPLNVTSNDVDLMAKVVYKESNAEPYEGKIAVASVILNRLKNREFPKSVDGVVKQRYAFSCVIDGKIDAAPNKSCYDAVYDALNGKDPTSNALYFYNPKLSSSGWMNTVKKYNVKFIGNHVFFIAD
ncbi:MAG: cell wall hydrolase [Clostridium sp.]|nr:cell wall hydrolase [Clostridium sp.]